MKKSIFETHFASKNFKRKNTMKTTIITDLVWHLAANEEPEGERKRLELCKGKTLFFCEASIPFKRFCGGAGNIEVLAWSYLPEEKEVLADLMRANELQNFNHEWIDFLHNNVMNL